MLNLAILLGLREVFDRCNARNSSEVINAGREVRTQLAHLQSPVPAASEGPLWLSQYGIGQEVEIKTENRKGDIAWLKKTVTEKYNSGGTCYLKCGRYSVWLVHQIRPLPIPAAEVKPQEPTRDAVGELFRQIMVKLRDQPSCDCNYKDDQMDWHYSHCKSLSMELDWGAAYNAHKAWQSGDYKSRAEYEKLWEETYYKKAITQYTQAAQKILKGEREKHDAELATLRAELARVTGLEVDARSELAGVKNKYAVCCADLVTANDAIKDRNSAIEGLKLQLAEAKAARIDEMRENERLRAAQSLDGKVWWEMVAMLEDQKPEEGCRMHALLARARAVQPAAREGVSKKLLEAADKAVGMFMGSRLMGHALTSMQELSQVCEQARALPAVNYDLHRALVEAVKLALEAKGGHDSVFRTTNLSQAYRAVEADEGAGDKNATPDH